MAPRTPTSASEIVKRIVKLQIQGSLYSFVQKSFAETNRGVEFQENWHLEMICDALQMCCEGKVQRLIINLPPRYLKSFCVSIAFPAWILGNKPNQRVIIASYSQALSAKHAGDCRAIMKSKWYRNIFPEAQIVTGQDTKTRFATGQKGYYFATSIGGTILGDGGNILIVDDPQTPLNVNSKKQREKVINWFQTSLMSRLDDKKTGVIIIVMQRLHPLDLTGYLLENEPEKWKHISFAAIAKETQDVCFQGKCYHSRNKGEPLQPIRDGVDSLELLASTIGAYAFQAQYQQSPILVDGGLVKSSWLTYYDQESEPKYSAKYISIDSAKSTGEQGDYSVISVMGVTEQGNHLLIDLNRGRYDYPSLRKEAKEMMEKYKPVATLIEDTSSGSSLIQELRFSGYQGIVPIKPKNDKVARFNHALVAIESGRFMLPRKAPFIGDFITELLAFPMSKHDDQVDTISQYFGWIYQRYQPNKGIPKIRQI